MIQAQHHPPPPRPPDRAGPPSRKQVIVVTALAPSPRLVPHPAAWGHAAAPTRTVGRGAGDGPVQRIADASVWLLFRLSKVRS